LEDPANLKIAASELLTRISASFAVKVTLKETTRYQESIEIVSQEKLGFVIAPVENESIAYLATTSAKERCFKVVQDRPLQVSSLPIAGGRRVVAPYRVLPNQR